MRKALLIVSVALAAFTGQLISGTPAAAAPTVGGSSSSQQGDIGTLASTRCSTIPINPVCTTGILAANPTGHWIDYTYSKAPFNQLTWEIKDVANGAVVARGDSWAGIGDGGRVNGLYGRYQMTMRCVCLSTGTLFNS